MQFISTPPCTSMKVQLEDEASGRIELVLADSVRLKGGVMAAVGGAFATFAVPFLRLPVPLPFKIVPLAFLGIGTGLGAAGAFTALADYSILVERGTGITMRWKWGPREARELKVPVEEIETMEIVRAERASGGMNSAFTREQTVSVFQLVLVTKKGDGYPLEEFLTEAQAKLRKKMLKRALRST